jgi:hypothetical protein
MSPHGLNSPLRKLFTGPVAAFNVNANKPVACIALPRNGSLKGAVHLFSDA